MRPVFIVLPVVMLLSACAAPREQEMFPSPYRAAGNEPFWHVTVTGKKALVERPDNAPVELSLSEITNVRTGWLLRGQGLKLNITTMRCENDMSGALFTNAVTMELDGRKYSGCGETELPPEKIEMTQWSVSTIRSQALTTETRQFLAIDAEGKVSGSDGCNRMSGGFALLPDGAVRHTAPGWIATRMACPNPQMALANDYGNALRASTQWRFEASDLVLLDTAGVPMIRYKRMY